MVENLASYYRFFSQNVLLMVLKKLLPYGVKDYYPEEWEKLSEILEIAEKELKFWGYREIGLPHLEFKKLFETTLGDIKKIFPVGDWEGEELALRYDFTPQILRFVFHQRRELYPLRIYYKGNVFKKGNQLWEEPTLGFELVGAESVEADAEAIVLTVNILRKLGFENFKILIGHRAVYDLLPEKFGKRAVEVKDFNRLPKEVLKNYDLFGKGWKSLELPKEAVKDLETLSGYLKDFEPNIEMLPSLVPPRDYYSGIFFKVILDSSTIVAGGGRYDNLFGKFGRAVPATGGGLKLLKLIERFVSKSSKPLKVFVIDTTGDKREGWKIANLLREKGFIAARDLVIRNADSSLKVAKEKGYDLAAVIKEEKGRKTVDLKKLKEVPEDKWKRVEELFKRFLSK